MSDDLVKRLRRADTCIFPTERDRCHCGEAADRILKLETLVKELLRSNWDNSWPTMRKYDTFEEYENAVLEGKDD
jgi:hypothetical protein